MFSIFLTLLIGISALIYAFVRSELKYDPVARDEQRKVYCLPHYLRFC